MQPPPEFNLAQFNRLMLSILGAVDDPAADKLQLVQTLRASMQDADVKVAARNLPKRVTVAEK
jgi:hypothetical protein